MKGSGNSYDFGARIYDPRLGRWMTIDPLQEKYPELSPYSFVANSPILFIDPDGKRITLGITDEEADAILEWGKGPKVTVGWTPGAYGNTTAKRIKLYGRMIKELEGKKRSGIGDQGLVFLVYITVLHEGQHEAENTATVRHCRKCFHL